MSNSVIRKSVEMSVLGLLYARRKKLQGGQGTNERSRKTVQNLSDVVQQSRNRTKTKSLIGFLLSHGARAKRLSMPPVRTSLRVATPTGHPAIKIRFG